jgi:hypothetical protein
MDRPFRHQALWILLGGVAGFVLWSIFSRQLAPPEIAESNFQANLLRLEHWKLDAAPADVLVGSSIGARLLPRYFESTPLTGIHNLSLDGSGPGLGLRILLDSTNRPRRVFIEVHRLGKPWHPNDDAILAAASGSGMRLAGLAPGFRASARPSTLLFSWIKSRQHPPGAPAKPGERVLETATALHRVVPEWERDLARQIQTLRDRGIAAILVQFPVGRENPVDPEAHHGADQLAEHLGIPLIDLNRESARRNLPITYTDNLHLTPDSATRVAHLLAELAGR